MRSYPRLFQPPRKKAIRAPRELVLDKQIEKVQMRERRGGRLLEPKRERFGHARESQMA